MKRFSIFICLWAISWASAATGYMIYRDTVQSSFDQEYRKAELGLRAFDLQTRVRCSSL